MHIWDMLQIGFFRYLEAVMIAGVAIEWNHFSSLYVWRS